MELVEICEHYRITPKLHSERISHNIILLDVEQFCLICGKKTYGYSYVVGKTEPEIKKIRFEWIKNKIHSIDTYKIKASLVNFKNRIRHPYRHLKIWWLFRRI